MEVATYPPTSPWDSMEVAPLLHLLSMVLHGCCQTSPPVVTGTERFPYNTCPKADQNCADLMRAEEHVTRRDVVISQTEGNSVSVVEDVLRVDRFSHKIVQVHQQGKTP